MYEQQNADDVNEAAWVKDKTPGIPGEKASKKEGENARRDERNGRDEIKGPVPGGLAIFFLLNARRSR